MQGKNLAWIASREYARQVARYWDRLLGDYETPKAGVRDVVYESWLRCKEFGVDPLRRAAPKAAEEPPEICGAAERRLGRVIEASLDTVAGHLGESRSALLGTSRTGHIFFSRGDARIAGGLTENSVVEGALWDERRIGTNAIGTALAVGGNVLIHGQEHFCNAGKQWSCAADVIRDPVDRNILGVVDLTGPAEALSLQGSALVAALVERIESELARLDLMDQITLIDRFHAGGGSAGSGMVVLDRRGKVVRSPSLPLLEQANIRQGAHLPGLKGVACDSWTLDLTHDALRDGELEWISSGEEVIGAAIHLRRRRRRPSEPASLPGPLQALLDSIPSQAETLRGAALIAARSMPVLVTGETGVGKDVLASAIHHSSPRAEKPFVTVNCAAIPRDLIGVELFGYVEGAFTGARRGGMSGRIEDAEGGTLFLDEIGDMPLEIQPYLLRAIESGTVSRLGESRPRRVDVRVIAATNLPLEALKDPARFRPDLYHRLNVARLHLPPLRERREDVPHLVARIYAHLRKAEDAAPADAEFIAALMGLDLPGNIRELRARVERHAAGLPLEDPEAGPPESAESDPPSPAPKLRGRAVERGLILEALTRRQGDVVKTAADLAMPKSTLYRKLAAYRAQGFL